MPEGEKYEESYYAMSRSGVGTKGFVDAARDRLIRNLLRRLGARGRLIDIGCGLGLFLEAMDRQLDLYGVDISTYAIEQARLRSPDVNFTVGSILDGLPADGAFAGDFDIVTAINIMEHLEQPASAVRAIRERISPNGLYVVHLPTIGNRIQRRLYQGSYDQDPTHIYRPSGREFSDMVCANGFSLCYHSYAPFVPGWIWRHLPIHPAYLAVYRAH